MILTRPYPLSGQWTLTKKTINTYVARKRQLSIFSISNIRNLTCVYHTFIMKKIPNEEVVICTILMMKKEKYNDQQVKRQYGPPKS